MLLIEPPDIFVSEFEEEDDYNEFNNLTDEEQELNQECINANYDQVPQDVLQMIEDELNERKRR